MKYFEVEMQSQYYCGFKSYWWIKAEDEHAVHETAEFENAHDEMIDYLQGWLEDEDPDDGCYPLVSIEEVTEEVYLEFVGTGGTG
jgi:regulatory protein YycI of two-component signal transduction system YycFG